MSFWDALRTLFAGKGSITGEGLRFAVRCGRCGEIVRVRADARYDLDHDFDEATGASRGLVLRKEVLGSQCPRLMRFEVRYDEGRREVARSVEGGEFVTLAD